MALESCVYCGAKITTRSREHVIQNALGGLYESTDICCPQCNNYISKYIDAPFTRAFNPIIGRIENFSKTNNTKSAPSYTGIGEYNGKQYPIIIKAGRVVACSALAQELRQDISKLDIKIISYDFNFVNVDFQNGMVKIAFNYALDRGVDLSVLQHGLNVQKNNAGISGISFSFPMFPFVALNPIDNAIELNTPMSLYHNLILFNQKSNLWCYIDLFNTFQYYVLLSDKYDDSRSIFHTYIQSLQKIDHTVPDLQSCGPKDLSVYAAQYGVSMHGTLAEVRHNIEKAILCQSQKKQMDVIFRTKLHQAFADVAAYTSGDMFAQWRHMGLYFDKNDCLRPENFRTVTYAPDGQTLLSYPEIISQLMANPKLIDCIRKYTTAKFNRLNDYLCARSK